MALHQAQKRFLLSLYLKAQQQVVRAHVLPLCNKRNVKLWKPRTLVRKEENSSLTVIRVLEMLFGGWGDYIEFSALSSIEITMCAPQLCITV